MQSVSKGNDRERNHKIGVKATDEQRESVFLFGAKRAFLLLERCVTAIYIAIADFYRDYARNRGLLGIIMRSRYLRRRLSDVIARRGG